MKNILFTIIFTAISFHENGTPRKIIVYSVNFFTRTIIAIPCEKFSANFRGIVDTSEVSAEGSIKKLDKFLEEIKYSKDSIHIDTRAKFVFINKLGTEMEICMDVFNISINGRLIGNFPAFHGFLRSLVPPNQLLLHPKKVIK